MSNYPKVSVVSITYGHEKYIKQTLEGVLMQNYPGPIEFIIANDSSPDNTDAVIKHYLAEKEIRPDLTVQYTHHATNLGMLPNFCWALQQTSGSYIALCEGDDYWTDPQKLQKQIDFLEANPDFSICYHAVDEISETGEQPQIVDSPDDEQEFTIEDLAKGNKIHTPSVVFRKNPEPLPAWFAFSPIGDYPLHMLNAQFGKIKYFPLKMAAYRVGSGLWSGLQESERLINTMFTLKLLTSHFSVRNKAVANILQDQYALLQYRLLNLHDSKAIIASFLKNAREVEKHIPLRQLARIIIFKVLRKLKERGLLL